MAEHRALLRLALILFAAGSPLAQPDGDEDGADQDDEQQLDGRAADAAVG